MPPPKQIFIVGAPKCGTSDLFYRLAQHPQVVGSEPKETYALLEESHPLHQSKTVNGIEELTAASCQLLEHSDLRDLRALPMVFVEGTTHHLYSSNARTAIHAYGESCKAIAVLRQPSDRILSSFLYTKHNLARLSKPISFEEYVDLLLTGRTNKILTAVGHRVSGPILADELRLSTYALHVSKWIQKLGSGNFRVLISEDYFRSPNCVVQGLWGWLGLNEDAATISVYGHRNTTKRVGALRLQKLATAVNRNCPRWLLPQSIKSAYFKLQSLLADSGEDYSSALRRLDEHFADSIESLETLLDRSLDIWQRP